MEEETDLLELANGWLDQHIEDSVDKDHICHGCHDETYAAALIAIGQELRRIRQLLEREPHV